MGFTLLALEIIHEGLLDDQTNVTASALVMVALSVLATELHSGAVDGRLITQLGVLMFWFTITSAKQLSFAFSGLVMENRYVPPCVIKIESKPLMASLNPE